MSVSTPENNIFASVKQIRHDQGMSEFLQCVHKCLSHFLDDLGEMSA